MSKTLEQIIEEMETLVDNAIANDGDIEIELLESLLKEKAEKIDGYGYVAERLSAEIEGAKAQLQYVIDRYDRKLRQLEVAKLRLEQRLLGMYQQGILGEKEKGSSYKLQFRNYPVVRLNVKAEDLPDEYKTVKVEVKPKLQELKKAIKDNPEEIMLMAELEDNVKVQFKL